MNAWFRRRSDRLAPVTPPGAAGAEGYQDGRRDEAARLEETRHDGRVERARLDEAHDGRIERARLDEAYERGRRDARSARRGSPLLTFLVLVVVVIGAGLIYLAVRNGSFSSGGAVVDRNLSTAAQDAKAPLRSAADSAGTALQQAGQTLKSKAGPPPS